MKGLLRHWWLRALAAVILVVCCAGLALWLRYDAVTPCGVFRSQLREAALEKPEQHSILTSVLIDRVVERASVGECLDGVWTVWRR